MELRTRNLKKLTVALVAVFGVALGAQTTNAAGLNAKESGPGCVPTIVDCIIVTVPSGSSAEGKKAYSTSSEIASLTEAELLARYDAEFIVARDLQLKSQHRRKDKGPSVRGQDIGL